MTLIGPILQRDGGYSFAVKDETGVHPGFPYRRIDDARHARDFEIAATQATAFSTVDDFDLAVAS